MSLDRAGVRLTWIAKSVADVLWWAALLLAAALVTVFLLSPVLLRSGINEVTVPVSHGDIQSERSLAVPSAEPRVSEVELQERDTTHHLRFRTTDWRLFLAINWVFLHALAVVLVAAHIFRALMADVLAARVFTMTNAHRLSRLGWLGIAAAVLVPPLQYWRSWIVLRTIELDAPRLSAAHPDWFDGSMAVGLLLLAVASVWRYGVQLQQDRDLTV